MNTPLPLEGITVLEFAQFLSGPLCGLRLADLGARVIKVERPGTGDLGRQIYLSDTLAGDVNALFQAINRNKQSFAANLKDDADKARVFGLIDQADVVIQNFRPGVFDRLGFSYDVLRQRNPGLVVASVTGYGDSGPWVDLPGQDLLAQARSGLLWINGADSGGPQPVGLAVADMLAGHNLLEGVLAALVRRGVTGQGGRVETSLLESLIDFQFEVLTTHLNDGGRQPKRASQYGAHAYLPAPYGVFPTADGHLAIAMTPVDRLMGLLEMPAAADYADPAIAFTDREDILRQLGDHLTRQSTQHWLDILQPHDIWCADVRSWSGLLASDGFKALEMTQALDLANGAAVTTTRLPLRIDGDRPASSRPAPAVGQHTAEIADELLS